MLLETLSHGRLHLTAIGMLAPHLTEANRETLLARACHKSKRQIEELLAELSPKPDVPAGIRKLPAVSAKTRPPMPQVELVRNELPFYPPRRRFPRCRLPRVPAWSRSRRRGTRSNSQRVRSSATNSSVCRRSCTPTWQPSSKSPVTEKLERLESKRYGETKTPRKSLEQTDTSPRSRYVPAAVRRAVRKRDAKQGRFVSEQGKRCTERRGLEFHHHDPFGRGGDHNHENMKKYGGNSSRVSEPAPI